MLERHSDAWGSPDEDEAWEALWKDLHYLASGIGTTYAIAVLGSEEAREARQRTPEIYPFLTPLRLVSLMREVADRIEGLTRRSEP